jgi:hypothetical protein
MKSMANWYPFARFLRPGRLSAKIPEWGCTGYPDPPFFPPHPNEYGPSKSFDRFALKVQSNWAQIKSDGLDGIRLSGEGLRYGQVFFQTLGDEHPNLAERIRATPRDPFHKDEVSTEIWDYCREMWDTTSF